MAETSVGYKCPNCSAPLTFLPGHDKVTCEYCGTELEVKTIEEMYAAKEVAAAKAQAAKEAKWDTSAAGSEWEADEAEQMKAFTCSSCGAQIVSDGNTMATECCYCGSPTMLPSRFEGMLKPDFIIPFKKTKEQAVAALKEFYKGRTLLPNSFTANNRVEDIQAMYVPFWLFDSKVSASGSYQGASDSVYETDDEVITTTVVYNCEREGTMSFERIPVDGSEKMDDTFMESIEPFDYKEMVPFSTAYLTGFLADKYDVDEILEDKFDWNQLKRLATYISPYKKAWAIVLFLMLSSSALAMLIPQFMMHVMDDCIPEKNMKGIFGYAGLTLVIALYAAGSLRYKIKITNEIGQSIIHQIRSDIFCHLQELPFSYYDD